MAIFTLNGPFHIVWGYFHMLLASFHIKTALFILYGFWSTQVHGSFHINTALFTLYEALSTCNGPLFRHEAHST